MRRSTLIQAALAILLFGASVVHGATITYTEQATASGKLGANGFSNVLVTITLTADTTGVTGSSGFFTNNGDGDGQYIRPGQRDVCGYHPGVR